MQCTRFRATLAGQVTISYINANPEAVQCMVRELVNAYTTVILARSRNGWLSTVLLKPLNAQQFEDTKPFYFGTGGVAAGVIIYWLTVFLRNSDRRSKSHYGRTSQDACPSGGDRNTGTGSMKVNKECGASR
jgi:hypothetical protein